MTNEYNLHFSTQPSPAQAAFLTTRLRMNFCSVSWKRSELPWTSVCKMLEFAETAPQRRCLLSGGRRWRDVGRVASAICANVTALQRLSCVSRVSCVTCHITRHKVIFPPTVSIRCPDLNTAAAPGTRAGVLGAAFLCITGYWLLMVETLTAAAQRVTSSHYPATININCSTSPQVLNREGISIVWLFW